MSRSVDIHDLHDLNNKGLLSDTAYAYEVSDKRGHFNLFFETRKKKRIRLTTVKREIPRTYKRFLGLIGDVERVGITRIVTILEGKKSDTTN